MAPMPRRPEPPWKSPVPDELLESWAQRARRLDKVLQAKGLTPRELSLSLGKSNAHVSHILSGRIESPSADMWMDIATQTGTTIGYLLCGELPMFRDADPHAHKFPSRLRIIESVEHLPAEYAHRVKSDLLSDSDHASDPGLAYWAAQLSALIAKHQSKSPV